MIKLRIRIKSDDRTYTQNCFLQDDFMISKNNEQLYAIVDKATKDSGFQVINEVKITSSFEW